MRIRTCKTISFRCQRRNPPTNSANLFLFFCLRLVFYSSLPDVIHHRWWCHCDGSVQSVEWKMQVNILFLAMLSHLFLSSAISSEIRPEKSQIIHSFIHLLFNYSSHVLMSITMRWKNNEKRTLDVEWKTDRERKVIIIISACASVSVSSFINKQMATMRFRRDHDWPSYCLAKKNSENNSSLSR